MSNYLPPELWAGPECTLVRVGSTYRDEFALIGHGGRLEDLDVLAACGVQALRYPVLWERVAPEAPGRCNWLWADARLNRLRNLGLRPIVGLLHHGSGPRYTNLLDPAFPVLLADYAARVAERYPWVESWTPLNEPLTTARFSGLYGLWYPHKRIDRAFVRALINQCRAVVLAMRAVRRVNPAARLVQTEDLAKTYSTKLLRYQATFENHRRWLTFDLLCGRVTEQHPLWGYLRGAGAGAEELGFFLEQEDGAPDILGINHYVTSERFLDQRLGRYPPASHGGNGRHRYADVEAVRVRAAGIAGPQALLAEAWQRYRLPLAVTEVQLACSREEQLRWFIEVWKAAGALRRRGVDVVAVTMWAVFGAVDWDSLLTRDRGFYETGAWDARVRPPRPTVLAQALSCLARGRIYDHPVLDSPGWWHRCERLLFPPAGRGARNHSALPARFGRPSRTGGGGARPILITGATGTLGRAFARLCKARGLAHHLVGRDTLDIALAASVAAAVDRLRPWAVINAAGYVRVAEAEHEPERCWRENVTGPEVLAHLCAERGIKLVTFSSDLVFDGCSGRPYVESDGIGPTTVYGRSKTVAEERVTALLPAALIVRTAAFFGPWDAYNLVTVALRELASGRPFAAYANRIVSPTYVPDLVHGTLDLLIDGESGIWHLANAGAVSWHDLVVTVARLAKVNAGWVEPLFDGGLPGPGCTALASERGVVLPDLEEALRRYVATGAWQVASG